MPRSFIAVEASEKIRNSLISVQKELEDTGADLKLVEPENIHLTLRFLGNISENRLEIVKDLTHEVTTIDSFELRGEGLGVFPKPSFIRVVWAGVSKGADELTLLRKKLDKKLAEINQSPADKEFTPHYTIARVKSGKAKDKLYSLVRDKSDRRWGAAEVNELKLKKSELTSGGPVYTTLETFELG